MPKCPVCGAEMVRRTARHGKYAGNEFWGCPNWPSCKGIINITSQTSSPKQPPTVLPTVATPQTVVNKRNYNRQSVLPLRLEAAPLKGFESMQTFESVACDVDILSKIRNKKILRGSVAETAKFRIDLTTQSYDLDKQQRQLCSIVLRLLCRGRITTNSPELDSYIRHLIKGTPEWSDDIFPVVSNSYKQVLPYSYDSSREEKFAQHVLPELLGKNWSLYTTPQAYITSMCIENEDLKEFYSQRVDFLITVDNKSYVVELDGPEHQEHKDNDESRDRILEENGYKVFRFANSEFDIDPDNIISELSRYIKKNDYAAVKLTTAEKRLIAAKYVHQLQIAITTAVANGVIACSSNLKIVHSIDGLTPALTTKLTKLAIEDLKIVFDNYCDLYGIGKFFNCTLSDSPDALICFGCVKDGASEKVVVSDIKFSYPIDNQISDYSGLKISNVAEETLHYFLKYIFKFDKFREGQYAGLERLLKRLDSIILLPTGSGKSLIYQLAALLVPGKTFIISPLISLMRDQLDNLANIGIDCAISLSKQSRPDKELNSPSNVMIYASPERLQIDSFRECVENMLLRNVVYAVAVDEAHCVSEWGHDFRTAYLNIGRTSRNIFKCKGVVPVIIALTGTASTAVLKDVKRELQITDYDAIITPRTFDRSELKFKVFKSQSSSKANKLRNIISDVIPDEFNKTEVAFYQLSEDTTNCGIVFCPHVNGEYGIQQVQDELNTTGALTDIFSGSAPKKFYGDWEFSKQESASKFKSNQVNILVATKAFGMGIDKPNVRFTIHYGVPGSIESFYQEAGRAGRDGNDALCTLILSKDNVKADQTLLDPTTPLSEVADIIESQGYLERDDISRMLFFHVNSFKGISIEQENVNVIIDSLYDEDNLVDYPKTFPCKTRDKLDMYQKAVQRLLVLGIVADCTVNYNQNELNITPGTQDQITIENNYAEYVRGYNEGRVTSEMAKMDRLLHEGNKKFAKDASLILIQFIYDTIERGRRRGLREMVNAAEAALNSADPDTTLRQRIVRYFESTYIEELNNVIESKKLGFEKLKEIIHGKEVPETNEVVGGIRSVNEAMGLRGEVSRVLESMPDHPGLLALRALAEMYCKDPEIDIIAEDFKASIQFALDKYSYPKEKLKSFILYFLKEILQHDQAWFITVIKSIDLHFNKEDLCGKLIESNDLHEEEKTVPSLIYFTIQGQKTLKCIRNMKGD